MLKKCLLVGIICLLMLLSFQVATAKDISITDTPPDWANGRIEGVFGGNFMRIPSKPIGRIDGYYEYKGRGRFFIEFKPYNVKIPVGEIEGYIIGPFMFGTRTMIGSGESNFVSIGLYTKTSFYRRIASFDTNFIYIRGTFHEFDQ